MELFSSTLLKLTQNGVSDQTIINIASDIAFEKYVTDKDWESFVSELEHYEDLGR